MIGCQCATCTSNDTKNKRRRASVLYEENGTRILVDASPDLRMQALDASISSIDAVIFTHAHADHMHGVDDVKGFNYHRQSAIPCYGDAAAIHALHERFDYAIAKTGATRFGHKPSLEPNIIDDYQDINVGGVCIKTFPQLHGKIPTIGLRFGNIAYSSDVNNFTERSLQALESLDVWVVDCLQREPAPTHAHLDMTLGWIARVKPKKAILTHMSHVLEYDQLERELPPNVIPAFDGMQISWNNQAKDWLIS